MSHNLFGGHALGRAPYAVAVACSPCARAPRSHPLPLVPLTFRLASLPPPPSLQSAGPLAGLGRPRAARVTRAFKFESGRQRVLRFTIHRPPARAVRLSAIRQSVCTRQPVCRGLIQHRHDACPSESDSPKQNHRTRRVTQRCLFLKDNLNDLIILFQSNTVLLFQ